MLPVLEGVIRRRILVNYRVDPALVAPLLPDGLEPCVVNGRAIVGVCLIGLEQIRAKGLPAFTGLTSENMAHRVAVRHDRGSKDGVFIFRRDTDHRLVSLFGGRLFPGVHGHASFEIHEREDGVDFAARTADGRADVAVKVEVVDGWKPTPAFATFEEVSGFFRRGSCGFSCGLEGELEAMELRTRSWSMLPLLVRDVQVPFYESRWPVEFDSALMMRNVPHEWHEVR